MKRVVFAALIAVFILSLGVARAQYGGTEKAAPALKAKSGEVCEVENVEGKVGSVTPIDPNATDAKPMITVVDNKGESTVFAITPTTTLYGADMKPITLDAIKQGAEVKVKGMCSKEGEGVATSVRLVK